ncbi:Uncharacterized Nudix hydrolase P35G2.12 [Serendipita indica DSM 11827]|nr:Uncharacterized Nudix hydrolase P35G2.12 [Serendipita indica DSM 11827]
MAQKAVVNSATDLPLDKARWITLKKIDWTDQEGQSRTWEMAERKTRGSAGVDAVAILAILNAPNRPPSTIIIEQFRPPVNAYVIELPAGLIDANESVESTAFRELEEETGYKADKVLEISPLMVCDPGMSSANMKLVALNVPLSESETGPDGRPKSPKQKLEQGEHIVRRVVEIPNLKAELEEYEKRGFVVDARLSHFAIAWDMATKFGAGKL